MTLASAVVDMSHGAGGRAMAELIEKIFRPHFSNPLLDAGNDFALLDLPPGQAAMTTDSYVVSPLFFPGGDIGSLAVHGTVNDLSMACARPLFLSAGFVLEEGFALSDLERIARSMGRAARDAGAVLAVGDTKVVERGRCDGVYINTTGIGVVPGEVHVSGDRARPGDAVLLSGSIGDHGIAILSHRAGLTFETQILSDACSLHDLVAAMVRAAPEGLRALRDPTRGGLAASLNEIAQQSGVGFRLDEGAIPVKEEVRGACELLGIDPLNVANEGKLVAVVAPEAAEKVVAAMKSHPKGAAASIIGEVTADPLHLVRMKTQIGGERVVPWLAGEALPRIC